MTLHKILFTLLLATLHVYSFGQQKFTEGTLVYKVTISGSVPTATNEPSMVETKSGTLTIFIKEDNIRQDIAFEDGYTHSRISNYVSGKELILQTINTLKYAIEISLKDQKKKNSEHYNAVITDGVLSKKINNIMSVDANAVYKNGTKFSFFYTKDFVLSHPDIFEKTPDLKGIPTMFDLLMTNGFSTHFELEKMAAEPISNSVFGIPQGYRIISKKKNMTS